MILNIGTNIYCHTTGFMNGNGDLFAKKGKVYKIKYFATTEFKGKTIISYAIIDEKGTLHTFDLDSLANGECKWFTKNSPLLLVEKKMELFYSEKIILSSLFSKSN